jgi:hypothetical protein
MLHIRKNTNCFEDHIILLDRKSGNLMDDSPIKITLLHLSRV